MDNLVFDERAIYQVRICGHLEGDWSHWFSGLMVTLGWSAGGPITTLTTSAIDQSALRGILTRLWDLNLTLLSAARLEQPSDRR